ncbi:MAG: prolyl oligopeptidase family serine peptidase [Atopobiaceae bacterium]|nr:prolyl oligopeptidase family serine peptidase [Atopobiaceae bacterium]
MPRTVVALLGGVMLCLSLAACGQQPSGQATQEQKPESQAATAQTGVSGASASAEKPVGSVANTIAENESALVGTYPSKFKQETYSDSGTGLSVTYNLFLPEGYDASASYPMVVFIADSTCATGNAERSLTQGLGGLVWATDEWQAAHPCIVCVPTYSETILDDHNGYVTTDYIEVTKRLIESVSSKYAVDSSRIYGTGQSMGCMVTLILASQHPGFYAGCMFVDGQWDVSTLSGLEKQRFVYFAAEDDERAFTGMGEVKAMFDKDSVPYASAQWQGTWTPDELSAAATELFSQSKNANFVSWASGSISAGSGGGMGSASYHMASFDYAYRSIAAMEWLFQTK